MNLIELKVSKEMHKRELQRLEDIAVNCTTCEQWRNQRCNAHDAVPPPEVKAAGCESWSWDGVPF